MVRRGRIADDERLILLQELGKIAQQRYNKNLKHGGHQYNLGILKNALQFSPNIEVFENYYWIDTGNQELNKIAEYFEYGTGIHNTRYRRGPIVPKKGKVMKFRKSWYGIRFAAGVQGVRPVFMMTKAVKSVENERVTLQRQIRIRLRI